MRTIAEIMLMSIAFLFALFIPFIAFVCYWF